MMRALGLCRARAIAETAVKKCNMTIISWKDGESGSEPSKRKRCKCDGRLMLIKVRSGNLRRPDSGAAMAAQVLLPVLRAMRRYMSTPIGLKFGQPTYEFFTGSLVLSWQRACRQSYRRCREEKRNAAQ
jgi:hypothetical protein